MLDQLENVHYYYAKDSQKVNYPFFSFLGLRADDVIIGDMILTHEQYEIMYGKGKEIEIIHRLFLVNCYLLQVPRLPS